MTTQEVLQKVKVRLNKVKDMILQHAPHNSNYVSIRDYKPVNFITVNNKKVFTNTNKLFNSTRDIEIPDGKGFIRRVLVDNGQVDYYRNAVLSPSITRFFHYGRYDYGMGYAHSRVEKVKNRNYLYYMRAELQVKLLVEGLSGEYVVEDDIENWR